MMRFGAELHQSGNSVLIETVEPGWGGQTGFAGSYGCFEYSGRPFRQSWEV
jgi:hypothetical protein